MTLIITVNKNLICNVPFINVISKVVISKVFIVIVIVAFHPFKPLPGFGRQTDTLFIISQDLEHSYFETYSCKILCKESEAGLLDRNSCLAPALGVTKFTIARVMILVTLCCAT